MELASNLCFSPSSSPAASLRSPGWGGSIPKAILALAGNLGHGEVPSLKYCLSKRQEKLQLMGNGAVCHPAQRGPTIREQQRYRVMHLTLHQLKPKQRTYTFQRFNISVSWNLDNYMHFFVLSEKENVFSCKWTAFCSTEVLFYLLKISK